MLKWAGMRSVRLVAGIVVVASTILLAPVQAAWAAGGIYPGGCRTGAYGQNQYPTNTNYTSSDWSSNCWAANNSKYLTAGNYVIAIQRLVQTNAYGCDPQGVDGGYGDHTSLAVSCFQSHSPVPGTGLDGNVGPKTWLALGYHTLYHTAYVGNREVYDIFDNRQIVEFQRIDNCSTAPGCSYYVLGVHGSSDFPLMNTGGPN